MTCGKIFWYRMLTLCCIVFESSFDTEGTLYDEAYEMSSDSLITWAILLIHCSVGTVHAYRLDWRAVISRFWRCCILA